MLLAAGLALAAIAFLLLPVVVAVTGARRHEDGGFDMSAQAAAWAGLLGVRLRRRDPSWELVPTLAGRAVGPGMRLGQPEVQAGAAGIPAAEAPAAADVAGGRGPRIAADGLRERLRSQSPLARPALRLARSLPGAFRLRRMRLDGVVGLADPEATGRLFGLVHALAPAAPERVALTLTPDFTHPCLHGRAEVRLHLRLARLLYMAARFGLAAGRVRAAARLRSWLAARGAGRKGNR